MVQRLGMIAAKASCRDIITERGEPLSCIQDTMSYLPVEVNGWSIERHKAQGLPGG